MVLCLTKSEGDKADMGNGVCVRLGHNANGDDGGRVFKMSHMGGSRTVAGQKE